MARSTSGKPVGYKELPKNPGALCRVLHYLRTSQPHRKLDDLASNLGVAVSTVATWEKPRSAPRLSYEDLERYQDFYGIPVCLTVSIADLVSAASEAKKHAAKGSKLPDEKLQVLARYMYVVANRVLNLDNRGREPLTAHKGPPDSTEFYDCVIEDLVATVRVLTADRIRSREVFQDEERLKIRQTNFMREQEKRAGRKPRRGPSQGKKHAKRGVGGTGQSIKRRTRKDSSIKSSSRGAKATGRG